MNLLIPFKKAVHQLININFQLKKFDFVEIVFAQFFLNETLVAFKNAQRGESNYDSVFATVPCLHNFAAEEFEVGFPLLVLHGLVLGMQEKSYC